MGRDAVSLDAGLHLACVAERDEVAGGFADDAEVRLEAALRVEVLEADAVAVLLADGAGHVDGLALEQACLLGQRRREDGGGEPTLHVHGTAAPDRAVHNARRKRRLLPLALVVDLHRIHVRIEVNGARTAAHSACHIACRIDVRLVET